MVLKVFFDYEGVIHYEFITKVKTANKEFYVQILCNLRDAIKSKRSEKWAEKS